MSGCQMPLRGHWTGGNWLASVSVRWNLFNGFGDKARIDEARHLLRRSKAEATRAGSAIRLEVRRAWADLHAANQRIEVARAAVEEAQESLRITQNRYTAGLNNVTDLLRNETGLGVEPAAERGPAEAIIVGRLPEPEPAVPSSRRHRRRL